MYPYQQLHLGLDVEPADEALEELLARVRDADYPYSTDHWWLTDAQSSSTQAASQERVDVRA